MELRHLRVFVMVADELHFGRSAKRLHVAQSAVSQTIRALEDEIGAKLFERTKRTVHLTRAGALFLPHARETLAQLDVAVLATRRAAAGNTGELRLRFTMMCSLTVLPRTIAKFMRRHPDVHLHIESSGSADQLRAIHDGRCDLGFMPRAAASDREGITLLASEAVEQSPLVIVLGDRHPFAKRRSVNLGALADEPLVFLKLRDEPQTRERFQRRCEAAGFEPRIVVEVESVESLLAFVRAGVGISCTPGFIRELRVPGIRTVPLRPKVTAGIHAVWHPGKLSETAARFLEMLRAERPHVSDPGTELAPASPVRPVT